MARSRQQIADGIAACLDHARGLGVKMAIEPLHPMYAADRSAVVTMAQARGVWEAIADPLVGVAVDVYHVWWDDTLADEVRRAGRAGALFGFHVCDWRVPTRDMLNDRGLMGDGCIDVRGIRGLVEDAGFVGMNEVEVFSDEYWAHDQADYLRRIVAAYREHT